MAALYGTGVEADMVAVWAYGKFKSRGVQEVAAVLQRVVSCPHHGGKRERTSGGVVPGCPCRCVSGRVTGYEASAILRGEEETTVAFGGPEALRRFDDAYTFPERPLPPVPSTELQRAAASVLLMTQNTHAVLNLMAKQTPRSRILCPRCLGRFASFCSVCAGGARRRISGAFARRAVAYLKLANLWDWDRD